VKLPGFSSGKNRRVQRSGEEIALAREDWGAGRFGEVHGYPGDPLEAPPLPEVPLRPR